MFTNTNTYAEYVLEMPVVKSSAELDDAVCVSSRTQPPPLVTGDPPTVRLPTATAFVNVTVAPENVGVPARVPDSVAPAIVGVVNEGDVPKTRDPEPVSSVTAAARLALEGVPRNVATPVPNPDTPVEMGSPVQLVRVPEAGVPSAGVTSVGLVARTTLPVPVLAVHCGAEPDDVRT